MQYDRNQNKNKMTYTEDKYMLWFAGIQNVVLLVILTKCERMILMVVIADARLIVSEMSG